MKKEKLRERRRGMTEALKEKLREAFQSVFPIALIVLVVRLLSGRRKAKRGPVTVASNTDADTKAEPNKK